MRVCGEKNHEVNGFFIPLVGARELGRVTWT